MFTFNPSNGVFTIESNDIDDLQIYDLKVTAKYLGSQYTNVAELPFKVTLLDHCADAVFTIDPTIVQQNPILYDIGYTANVQTFDEAKVTSTASNCPPIVFAVTT